MIEYNTINLENTINSGQVFLWKKQKEFWHGINDQDVLKIDDSGNVTSLGSKKYDFFRNSDDIEKIINQFQKTRQLKLL